MQQIMQGVLYTSINRGRADGELFVHAISPHRVKYAMLQKEEVSDDSIHDIAVPCLL